MEWSKIKNIILLILVVTNLSLLAILVQREAKNRRLQDEARSDAILFLSNNGVEVSDSVVPRRMTLRLQTVERDRDQERALARALLDGDVEEESWGGEVYRYSNKAGAIQFHSDGLFQGEFTPGAYPLGDLPLAGHALRVLSLLQFEGEVLSVTGGDREGQGSVTLRQIWKGTPLFGMQVTLNYEDGCLVSMTAGRRLHGKPADAPNGQPITVATALIGFFSELNKLGDVCSRINSITQGYSGATTLSGPVTLVPMWYITTDTGVYQLDAMTGALSRAAD